MHSTDNNKLRRPYWSDYESLQQLLALLLFSAEWN